MSMSETNGVSKVSPAGSLLSGLSPGPMTLVSNFFPDSSSFSQLLAGAMASPLAQNPKNYGDQIDKNLVVAAHPHSHSPPMIMIPPALTPSAFLHSPAFFSPPQSPFGMSHTQALAHVTAQATLSQSYMHLQSEYQPFPSAASAEPSTHNPPLTSSPVSDSESAKMESSEVSQSVDKQVNDGYKWRKYGQKQVKASEYPRSYYKCTQLNCPVKKKVERSLDGRITEVIYKGQHNHEPPRPNKRENDGGGLGGNMNSQAKPELGLQGQIETRKSDEDMDGDELRVDDGDNDEPIPKRRNVEVGAFALASSHKAGTKPRIVVQTRSEVDLLDDGYKWRKYGQKVVKGNPHPRSYYKCTYAGCNVRKHVERASTDPKSVVTSYEGKHNHNVLAIRNRPKDMDIRKDQRHVL